MQIRTPADVAFESLDLVDACFTAYYGDKGARVFLLLFNDVRANGKTTTADLLNRVHDAELTEIASEWHHFSLAHAAILFSVVAVEAFAANDLAVSWNAAVESVRLATTMKWFDDGANMAVKARSEHANNAKKDNKKRVIAYYMANKDRPQFLKKNGTPNKAKIIRAIIDEGVVDLSEKQIGEHLVTIK